MTTPDTSGNSTAKKAFIVAFVAVMLSVSAYAVWANLARWHSVDEARAQARPVSEKTLDIVTASGRHTFNVDVMRTDADRAKGLMFRQSMPQDYGMLFDFGADIPVSMWMKNTYIPLDMIFIFRDGTIHRIAQRTEPHSERTISSLTPVRAVLEVNAGVSEKLGLKSGDRIVHHMFPAN